MSSDFQQAEQGPDVLHDRKRLEALAELDLDEISRDGTLRRIVDEAADELDLPVSLLSLVLDQSQIFPLSRGLTGWLAEAQGSPVEWSFCVNAVRSELPFVVEDAREHPAVKNIPLVEQDGIRCYAGIPLRARNGSIVGTLCVIGPEERIFTEDDLQILRQLADRATRRIQDLAKPA
jgi:GAF domain-containing protein